jgi:cell shape-determining protein MreD
VSRRSPPLTSAEMLLGVPLVLSAPVWVPLLRYSTAELFAVGGVGPDVAPLAAVAAAWTRRPGSALLFAVILGASLDLASATPWGLGCARFLFLSLFVTRLRQAVDLEGVAPALLLGLGYALAERGAAALTLGLWAGLPLEPLLIHAGLVALYSAALAPLAFLVAQRLPGPGPLDSA